MGRKKIIVRRPKGTMPEEPSFPDLIDHNDFRLASALNWYNYLDVRDKDVLARSWVLEYMDGRFSEKEIAAMRRVEGWRINNVVSAISRMILNGVQFSDTILEGHRDRILKILEKVPAPVKRKVAKVDTGPSRATEAISDLVGVIEEKIDAFTQGGYKEPFSTYDLLTGRECTAIQAKAVAEKYRPVLEEVLAVKAGGDPQLKEAYSDLTRTQINRLVDLVRSIVEDSDRYAGNKRSTRKPRQPKKKNASQLVKDVKYLKEHPELKIVSVDPSAIIGAKTVWLYNIRYRTLSRIVAKTEDGFHVTGTTIKNIDEESSVFKYVRPEKVLPQVLDAGSAKLKSLLTTLKNQSYPATGRINENTVILRTTR